MVSIGVRLRVGRGRLWWIRRWRFHVWLLTEAQSRRYRKPHACRNGETPRRLQLQPHSSSSWRRHEALLDSSSALLVDIVFGFQTLQQRLEEKACSLQELR